MTDIERLKLHVRKQFEEDSNPYVSKGITIRRPKHDVDSAAYTDDMYSGEFNSRKCFCQMCKGLFLKNI